MKPKLFIYKKQIKYRKLVKNITKNKTKASAKANASSSSINIFLSCGLLLLFLLLLFYTITKESSKKNYSYTSRKMDNKSSLITVTRTRKTSRNQIPLIAPSQSRDSLKTKKLSNKSYKNEQVHSITVQPSPRYYVSTQHCHIPFVNPYSAAVRKIFKSKEYLKCAKGKPLVYSTYERDTRQYMLQVNYGVAENITIAPTKNISLMEDVSCCYRQIIRSGHGRNADNKYKLLPCSLFHQNFAVPKHIDFMIVECISKSTKKIIQKDAFSFIQYKNLTWEQSKKPSTNAIKDTQYSTYNRVHKPSVLLIGIDSLSRMNFRRNMPKTYEHLRDSWYELKGYNKVGDNTFPNLMALLTGLENSEIYTVCKPKIVGGLETKPCHMIWRDFKTHGYHTAYAEDIAWMSTFNFNMMGFSKPPTDYYFRPFDLAIENNLKIKEVDGLAYCVGRKQHAEYIYDYGLQFAKTYLHEPMFGLFWTNSFSHNSYDTPSRMDTKMLEYLQAFAENGVLDESIVIFFSDHGKRWGYLLTLPEGFLEERLPMFFISIPTWFRKAYPKLVTALEVNQHRLTSPYDIYMTLKHLLALSQQKAEKPPPPSGCKACQSIFYELPFNRTCEDAGITEHWCTCIPYSTVSTGNRRVKELTSFVINEMNKYLKVNKLESKCDMLKLRTIRNAAIKINNESVSDTPIYRIEFKTGANTKTADFEVTASYNGNNKLGSMDVEQSISRLTRYTETSMCITNKKAKKYCLCKENIANKTL